MEYFGILSPTTKGIVGNVPSILLDNRSLIDGDKFIFRYGEVQRMKLRNKQFTQILDDTPLAIYQYWQQDGDFWLLIFTKRDILYRDDSNNKFVFLTPQYSTGTISVTNGDATVVGSGTDFTQLKVGDFITIGTGYDSADTWYEIDSITDATHLELTTNYAGSTDSGLAYLARQTYAGGVRDYWRVETFNDKIIATNNGVNWIQTWAGTGQFSDLNTDFKCKYLYVYENHLLCGYTTESGTDYPRVIRGSDLNDETDFTPAADSDAVNTTIKSTYYNITGFSELNGNLVVFTERSIEEWWYVGGEDIYNSKQVVDGVGAWAPDSIIPDGGSIYFYSSDSTFRRYTSFSWDIISDPIDRDVKNFHPDYDNFIQAYLTEEYNQILWAVPTVDSEGRLNKLLTYDINSYNDSWGQADIEVSCFGAYLTEGTYTWDTLPYNTWDTWAWTKWNTRFGLSNSPIDLVGDYDKYLYQMFGDNQDKGADYSGYVVLGTNLSSKKSNTINVYKWLQEVQLIFRGETSGTVALHIKRDFEINWQSIGSIDLTSQNEINFNQLSSLSYQGRHFQLKITGSNQFRIIGAVFGFLNLRSTRG